MRARVVGDLPVALGLDEMMRQVVALQMVVKDNALVDGKGNKIADSPSTPAAVADNFSKSFLTNNVTFYNKQIIGVVGGAAQSPVDLRGAQQDEDLGQLSFNYTPIWAADPDPWSPGALSGTVVSPQPSLVKNTGLTWEMEVARHHQMILTNGPLHEKDYRLALVNAHWGGSEHSLKGKLDGRGVCLGARGVLLGEAKGQRANGQSGQRGQSGQSGQMGKVGKWAKVLLGKVGKAGNVGKGAEIPIYIPIKKTMLVVVSLLIYFLCARLYIGVLSASI